MPYRFVSGETVTDGLRRIAEEQVGRALSSIEDGPADRHEAVHEVRKRMKKLRALVRLVRPAMPDTYAKENAAFRDLGRELSDPRDSQSVLEAFDGLTRAREDLVDPEAFAPLRNRLVEERDRRAAAPEDVSRRLGGVAEELEGARRRIGSWSLDEEGFDALRGGLAKTYRRGRSRMRDAYRDPSTEIFHEWRKRVKYHRYHLRLLRDLWPAVLNARREELHRLSDRLGEEHDLALLMDVVRNASDGRGESRPAEALRGLAAHRRSDLRALARPLGRRLFAEKPKRLAGRVGALWDVFSDWGRLDSARSRRPERALRPSMTEH